MTAEALGRGLATGKRVLATYRKDPESLHAPPHLRGRPTSAVEVSPQAAMRASRRQAPWAGRHVTCESIRRVLQEPSPDASFPLSTLARTLERWGFECGPGRRTQPWKDPDALLVARPHSVSKRRPHRVASGPRLLPPDVEGDEADGNKTHSNDGVWYAREEGPWIHQPTGQGERLLIRHALTKDGGGPAATVVLHSTRKTGEYQGPRTGEVLQTWVGEKGRPPIPHASRMMMEKASSHPRRADSSAPTPPCSKEKIRPGMEANTLPWKEDCGTVERSDLGRQSAPAPPDHSDRSARQHGHEVRRTPPYHPELHPREMGRGIRKNEGARHGDCTRDKLTLQ
jgi:transposase